MPLPVAASVWVAVGLTCVAVLSRPAAALAQPVPDVPTFQSAVGPFLKAYCTDCHGPIKQKAKLRLDTLAQPTVAKKEEAAVWISVYEQLVTAQMPPAEASQPTSGEVRRVKDVLRVELGKAGVAVDGAKSLAYPGKANLVDHDALFGKPSSAAPATPERVWRLSPFAYREFADDLTGGRLIVKGGPSVVAKQIPLAPAPFGLTSDPGFRDYAFRYQVSGSETLQLAMNAKTILNGMLTKRPRSTPPAALLAVANASDPPTADQLHAAVKYLFDALLYRPPTAEELARYTAFVTAAIEKFGSNRDGLVNGLVPLFLHPEAVFRSEFGAGMPDSHGRKMLAPLELAVAIAYALTDSRPDAALVDAARSGKLATREDVIREVTRLLNDSATDKPRILRFFHEFFEYDRAPDVFKDPRDLKAAGIYSKYAAEPFVADTDMLVMQILKADRDVLRELLTTDQSYVGYSFTQRKGSKTQSPFGTKPGQSELYKHYNYDLSKWSDQMPMTLPKEQRAGILTQPAWLIAHSANTENHAIHRGKWVRERLLGGSVPDTPITVEAKLPDEPNHTLRHRMRVTRVDYCFTCHRQMDPLGLPFEMFDHLGQFRTKELGQSVDTSGAIVGSGDPKLDGPVADALELIRKLAGSERVSQVFVRHAFRYWMGRNETFDDAPTLQAAHRAYTESGGSMKALIVSLLTSDSFLYRRTATH